MIVSLRMIRNGWSELSQEFHAASMMSHALINVGGGRQDATGHCSIAAMLSWQAARHAYG